MHVSMNLWASHFKRIFVEEFYYCYCEVEFTIQLSCFSEVIRMYSVFCCYSKYL